MQEKYQLRVVYLSWLTEQVSAPGVKSLTLQYATTLGTHSVISRVISHQNSGRRCHTLAHSEKDALTLESLCSGTRLSANLHTEAVRRPCTAALEATTAGTQRLALVNTVERKETRGQCPQD